VFILFGFFVLYALPDRDTHENQNETEQLSEDRDDVRRTREPENNIRDEEK
jgi:hypothetical protein